MKFAQTATAAVPWVIQLNSAMSDQQEAHKSGVMLHLTAGLADKIQSTVKALGFAGCDTCSSQVEEQFWLYDKDVGRAPGVLFMHFQSDGQVNFSASTPRGALVSRNINVSELSCAVSSKKKILIHAHDDGYEFLTAVHRVDLAVLLSGESVSPLDTDGRNFVDGRRPHMGQGG